MEWPLHVSSLWVGTVFSFYIPETWCSTCHDCWMDGWTDGWMSFCPDIPGKGEQRRTGLPLSSSWDRGSGRGGSRALELDTFCFRPQLCPPDRRVTLAKSLQPSSTFLIHAMGAETASHHTDD